MKTYSIMLLALSTTILCGSLNAKADIVVGANVRYGTLIVVGTPNKNVQSDTTFDIASTTVGTRIEDSGEATGKPLNTKVRMRVGQYRLEFSNTATDIEIREDQMTTVKLQKVIASPMDQTSTVELKMPRVPTEDDDSRYISVATWQRTSSNEVATGHQICTTYNDESGPFGLFPVPHQDCRPEYKNVDSVQSWKSAYFLVLPGTYSMDWTFADGTDHQEDGIVVR